MVGLNYIHKENKRLKFFEVVTGFVDKSLQSLTSRSEMFFKVGNYSIRSGRLSEC